MTITQEQQAAEERFWKNVNPVQVLKQLIAVSEETV